MYNSAARTAMSWSRNTQRETWWLEPETTKRGKRKKKKHKPPVSTSTLQHKLSEHKELEAETIKFSSHILFLLGLHFNQTHWQSSCGPGMTSIKVGEQGTGGSGKSVQEEKWGDGVKDRGSIVKVFDGQVVGERGVRWKTVREKERNRLREMRAICNQMVLWSAHFSSEFSWPPSIKLGSRKQYIMKVLTWENSLQETNPQK